MPGRNESIFLRCRGEEEATSRLCDESFHPLDRTSFTLFPPPPPLRRTSRVESSPWPSHVHVTYVRGRLYTFHVHAHTASVCARYLPHKESSLYTCSTCTCARARVCARANVQLHKHAHVHTHRIIARMCTHASERTSERVVALRNVSECFPCFLSSIFVRSTRPPIPRGRFILDRGGRFRALLIRCRGCGRNHHRGGAVCPPARKRVELSLEPSLPSPLLDEL